MKAAASVAATYGIVFIPGGMTAEEAMLGLLANVKRTRARATLDQVQAISIALGEGNAVELVDAVSDDRAERVKARFSEIHRAGVARMRART